MNTKTIIESLQKIERDILTLHPVNQELSSVASALKVEPVAVRRGLLWLENKKLVEIRESANELVLLDENGAHYQKAQLPEQRILDSLAGGKKTAKHLKKEVNISDEELNVSIGALKSRKMVSITNDKNGLLLIARGKSVTLPEQQFLAKKFPLPLTELDSDDIKILEALKKRKSIVKIESQKDQRISLTTDGKTIAAALLKSKDTYLDKLTPSSIKNGEWKHSILRRYDVSGMVPKIHFGKKQPYRRFLEEVRTTFLSMGFKEMTGPMVESEFWNMDALFMPQFHSARDIHDAYYVKEPKFTADLPAELVKKIKHAHEKGVSGSRGWNYAFSEEKTSRLVLRTHDTAISPRTLSSKELHIPGKYFQIARCFRYDVIDATHNADFDQIGGFVIDDGLNLRHLFGLLRMLANQFCRTDEVKVVPSYFPFTEPSAALYAKHPTMGWIELAGAGIFRPEMTEPLGVDKPVIAWGIGLGRVAMFRLGLNDIRQLYSHDLQYLRSARVI